jgi:hypothetical protein
MAESSGPIGSGGALKVLDSMLLESSRKKITKKQVMIILDALAGSSEPALIARFPVVLAICARRGIDLDSQGLFARYWSSSPKKQNLEKLLLISAILFETDNISLPAGLRNTTENLKRRHGSGLSHGVLRLSTGVSIPIDDFRTALKHYLAVCEKESPEARAAGSRQVHMYLERLFSPRQKDLIFQKLRGETFTKTEREYYSRVVRKKLEALSNQEVRQIADALLRKAPH